jgi:hypothetical protein
MQLRVLLKGEISGVADADNKSSPSKSSQNRFRTFATNYKPGYRSAP